MDVILRIYHNKKKEGNMAGFSQADKNVHFDPLLLPMTPKTVHRGDSDVPQIS